VKTSFKFLFSFFIESPETTSRVRSTLKPLKHKTPPPPQFSLFTQTSGEAPFPSPSPVPAGPSKQRGPPSEGADPSPRLAEISSGSVSSKFRSFSYTLKPLPRPTLEPPPSLGFCSLTIFLRERRRPASKLPRLPAGVRPNSLLRSDLEARVIIQEDL